jgi:hypothetical protein
MRATGEQVRLGVLHPERLVRDAALRYFAESSSQDTAVMPLVIRAIETYGWDDAFRQSYHLADLAETDETLLWTIEQLDRIGHPKAYEDQQRCDLLSQVIAQADVALLMTHEQQVLGLEGLGNEHREAIAQRLRLTMLDTASCWQELEAFFDRDLAAAGIAKVDFDGPVPDVHCLCRTFATLLSKSGAVPRIAQDLMRHSRIKLTMDYYTDPILLDVAGAVESLPDLQTAALSRARCPAPTGTADRLTHRRWAATSGLSPLASGPHRDCQSDHAEGVRDQYR